jgi:hypothetical protein
VISPTDERAQEGGEGFTDVVAVDVWDPDQALFAAVRVARAPAVGSSSVSALLVADGELVGELADDGAAPVEDWAAARAGGVELDTRTPLEHWEVRVETPGGELDCELRAITAPVTLSEPEGQSRYVQLCDVRGTVTAGGRRRQIEGRGVRTHAWGDHTDSQRLRFLHAATDEGSLVTVAAVRPPQVDAHGEELVAGQITDPQGDEAALPLEQVRLSTVFDDEGLPRTAGLELYRPGDELPARLAGQVVWRMSGKPSGGGRTIGFFRWVLDGRPAWGTYEIESP